MRDKDAFALNAIDDSDPPPRREWTDVAIEIAWFFPNMAKLLGRLALDPRIPMRRKVPVGAAIAYVLSPMDFFPDSVPGIGLLDDAIAVSVAVDNLIAGEGEALLVEHWDGSIDALDIATSLLRWTAGLAPYRSKAR